jgi:septum formation protein
VLASASPRRAGLLRGAGYRFRVLHPQTDETLRPRETPERAAERLARDKALDVAARVKAGRVVAADTLVVVGGRVLGKPAGRRDAGRMLRMLSGRTHRVVTGVAVCGPAGTGMRSGRCVTRVTFSRLTDADISWYVRSGEPMDKAGAYGIQGKASLLVERISGSYTNVVGLPMELVRRFLGRP